jgi:hypothetical protein
MRPTVVPIGLKINAWTSIAPPVPGSIAARRRVSVRCDCGAERILTVQDFLRGKTRSCGCLKRSTCASNLGQYAKTGRRPKHGHAAGRVTATYRSWAGIIQRCTNPRSRSWKWYGARGIAVCDRWRDFEAFLADMGPRSNDKHSIDRINNEGDYEPGNCRWATPQEQRSNQRRTTSGLR